MSDDAWSGVVVKKTRALLDGSNLYRRLKVRDDDGQVRRRRVGRDIWKAAVVGDHLVKEPGQDATIIH